MPVFVIDTIKPKNNGSFPVVDAADVAVAADLRLPEVLEGKADASALAATNAAVAGKANSSDVATETANLQGQINQIVISASSEAVVAPEVAAARVGDDGTEYSTLKERLDAENESIKNDIKNGESDANYALSQISEITEKSIEFTSTSSKLIASDGSFGDTSSDRSISDYIDVSEYPFVYVTAQSGYMNLLYAFYDASKAFISGYSGEYASTKSITDQKARVPENAKYIVISKWGVSESMSCKYLQYDVKGMDDIREDIETINADIADTDSALNHYISETDYKIDSVIGADYKSIPYTKINKKLIGADGVIEDYDDGTTDYVSDLIDVSSYPSVYVTASSGYLKRLFAFYDENEDFVSDYAGEYAPLKEITDMEVAVPATAKYIRISQWTATPMQCKYKSYSVNGMSELEEDVDSVKDSLADITTTEEYDAKIHAASDYEFGYVTNTGYKNTDTQSYVYTENIPVIQGDVVRFKHSAGGSALNMRFVCAYNDNNVVSDAGDANISSYTVPAGVNSVVLSVAENSTSQTNKYIEITRRDTKTIITGVNNTDSLFGKKWCVIGDSFTYGGYSPMNVFDDGKYEGYRKVYPYYIGNRTDIDIVDFSAGGRTLAFPAVPGAFVNSITCPTADCYYQNIPADVDYITIYLGINDSHHASGGGDGEDPTGYIPIGTVNDDTTDTFGGAWNVVLSWLIENRPNAHIGIIVSNGCDSDDYRTLTIAIAQKYGIPYIDLNGDQLTPAMLRTTNPNIASAVKSKLLQKWSVDYPDNQHPTDAAHEFESYCIEAFLRRI